MKSRVKSDKRNFPFHRKQKNSKKSMMGIGLISWNLRNFARSKILYKWFWTKNVKMQRPEKSHLLQPRKPWPLSFISFWYLFLLNVSSFFFSIFWCTLQPKLFILYFISHRGRKKSPLHMDTKILIMRFLTHMIQSRRIGRMFHLGGCKKSYCQRLPRKNVLI